MSTPGVEVTGTSISITSGNPIVERENQHQVTFDLNIGTNPEGGSVIGNNLWAVSFYYSTSDIPENGVSSPSSSVSLRFIITKNRLHIFMKTTFPKYASK